jgi:hypothetical protein
MAAAVKRAAAAAGVAGGVSGAIETLRAAASRGIPGATLSGVVLGIRSRRSIRRRRAAATSVHRRVYAAVGAEGAARVSTRVVVAAVGSGVS